MNYLKRPCDYSIFQQYKFARTVVLIFEKLKYNKKAD